MLNLLSNYVGYESWYDFKKQKESSLNVEKKAGRNKRKRNGIPTKQSTSTPQKENQQKNYWYLFGGVIALILTSIIIFWDNIFPKTYKYCFVNADRDTSIHSSINIKVIKETNLLFITP